MLSNSGNKELSTKNSICSKIYFRYEGEIKNTSGKEKLKEFMTSRNAIQENLKKPSG